MATKYNLKVEQGTTYGSPVITWKDGAGEPMDLTGYTARMHVRGKIADTTTLLELTTENGRIILGGALGTVRLHLTATDTAAITWSEGVYDLELVNGSYVKRFLEGKISVSKEVTR